MPTILIPNPRADEPYPPGLIALDLVLLATAEDHRHLIAGLLKLASRRTAGGRPQEVARAVAEKLAEAIGQHPAVRSKPA